MNTAPQPVLTVAHGSNNIFCEGISTCSLTFQYLSDCANSLGHVISSDIAFTGLCNLIGLCNPVGLCLFYRCDIVIVICFFLQFVCILLHLSVFIYVCYLHVLLIIIFTSLCLLLVKHCFYSNFNHFILYGNVTLLILFICIVRDEVFGRLNAPYGLFSFFLAFILCISLIY